MKKIHSRGQLFLYAMAGMGVNMLNLMMGSYLCSALLVGGFGEEAIPYQTFAQRDLVIPGAWAVFSLVARILDGIIDVPMASFSDHLRTRWGRRRPMLLLGLAVMVAAFLLFLGIPQQGATWLNTIYYGVVLCVFYSFYTLTMVTYYATFTEIVETEKARATLSNIKAVFDIVYFILGYVAVRMLLNGVNIRTVALMVLPIVATMLIPLFMIKEKSTLDRDREEGDAQTVNLVRSLSVTFRNKPFIRWMLVYSFMNFGVQLFLSGINEYFSFVGMNMIFVMLGAFLPVPFTLILYNRIKAKRGFGFAYRYTLVCFAVGMLTMFGVGLMEGGTVKTVLSILSGLIASMAIGAMFAVSYSVPAQLAAEEAARTGISNSAMYFAVQGLFAGVSSGIGGSLVLTALKGSENSDSSAIQYMTLICALGVLVALAMSFGLPQSIMNLGKVTQEGEKRE